MRAPCLLAAWLLCGACLLPASGAGAEPVSPWSRDGAASVRLAAGAAKAEAGRLAGIEIRLDPGWRTYWIAPGDSGLPPRLDWSGSDNLASIEVRWPVPMRFPEGEGTFAVGYRGTVVLPLVVTARDPSRPVRLAARFEFGICREICVPAEVRLALPLRPGEAPEPLAAAQIDGFASRVPVAAAIGAQGPLAIVSAARSGDVLTVEARVPAQAAGVDLFAHGEDHLGVGVPVPAEASGPLRRWRVPLRPLPGSEQRAGRGVLVLAAEGRAIAVPIALAGRGF